MSRKTTRKKARGVGRRRKKQEEFWLPGDPFEYMPTPEPVKPVRVYKRPINRKEQKKDFKRLGIPPTVYGKLWEWGATPETVEPVLKFLKRVKFWREGQELAIEWGRRVYGRGRDSHHDPHPEEPGEIFQVAKARFLVVLAIRNALNLHYSPMIHAYDPCIALALPHMEAALKELEQKADIEVDPMLPRRTPGQKPKLRMPLREGEAPGRVRRREIERTLKSLLLPLHPRRNKIDVKFLAQNLLDPILP